MQSKIFEGLQTARIAGGRYAGRISSDARNPEVLKYFIGMICEPRGVARFTDYVASEMVTKDREKYNNLFAAKLEAWR